MPPIQARFAAIAAAVAASTAASAASVAVAAATHDSDDSNDSSDSNDNLSPKDRARRKSEVIFAFVLVNLLILGIAAYILSHCVSSCWQSRTRIRERLRARTERMQARNGLGWFDRWTVSPLRRPNWVQRRRARGHEEVPSEPPPAVQQVPRCPTPARQAMHPGQRPSSPTSPSSPGPSNIDSGLPVPPSSPAPSYRSRDAAASPPPYHPNNEQNV